MICGPRLGEVTEVGWARVLVAVLDPATAQVFHPDTLDTARGQVIRIAPAVPVIPGGRDPIDLLPIAPLPKIRRNRDVADAASIGRQTLAGSATSNLYGNTSTTIGGVVTGPLMRPARCNSRLPGWATGSAVKKNSRSLSFCLTSNPFKPILST